MKKFEDLPYEELYDYYLKLVDEMAHVMFMMRLRKKIDTAHEVSAQMKTEKLIERCKEFND